MITISSWCLRWASMLGLGLALAGCAAGGGWAAGLVLLVSIAGLGLSGCTTSHMGESDARVVGTDGATNVPDGATNVPDGGDAGLDGSEGHWEACCVEGRVESCFCPGSVSCNYGNFEFCGDGACVPRVSGTETCPGGDGGVDAGVDAGGTWEPCCMDGHITTCLCPAGTECNYGWYEDCGGGTCVGPGAECSSLEEGTWQPCCVDGAIDTCFCPAGVACNYGYTICDDGTCAGFAETCDAP